MTRSFFVFAPSFTLAYALDPMDTVLVQDAFVSRQGPVLRSGSRGFVAVQRAIGNRVAIDVDYERNLAPLIGRRSSARLRLRLDRRARSPVALGGTR